MEHNRSLIAKDHKDSYIQGLTSIYGWANFENSKIADLGQLTTIGGRAYFKNSQVTDLGQLTTIGGWADFENSQITDLGQLTTIGGYANFENSQVTNLGQLNTIGGWAYFKKSQITNLGRLTTIGGGAFFDDDLKEVTILGKVYNHQVIDGYSMVDFRWREKDGVRFAHPAFINGDLSKLENRCYVANIGEHYAHGRTLAEAIEDCQFKLLESKDVEEHVANVIKRDAITFDEWRVITKACRYGTAHHLGVEPKDLPNSMPLPEAIEKSKGTSFGQALTDALARSGYKT